MALPVIAITNQTSVLTDAEVQAAMVALQRQVSLDFRGYWDMDCTLTWLSKGEVIPDGWWQIVLLDNPDMAGALGYHEMTAKGEPLGKIFAKLDIDGGYSWTVTLSHELLEMLVDPWIDYCVVAQDGKVYALEVCDAVEDDSLGYKLGETLVSDFVTPAWFESTAADRQDFKSHLAGPLQLAPGGYISIFENNNWTQIQADGARTAAAMHPGSRRHRRFIKRSNWRRSDR